MDHQNFFSLLPLMRPTFLKKLKHVLTQKMKSLLAIIVYIIIKSQVIAVLPGKGKAHGSWHICPFIVVSV